MTVPPGIISAAAAWASDHGCHNIGSCSATPLEAFIAGAAAERDRCVKLAEEHNAVADPCYDEQPFADLLRAEP